MATQPVPKETETSQSAGESQPAYTPPRTRRAAVYPALELSLAVFSILAATWLLAGALEAAIKAFGAQTPGYDFLTRMIVTNLEGYTGIIIVSLGAVMFAGLALWLFGRVRAAVDDARYRGILQVGAGIVAIKTLIVGMIAVAVGLTPLLTIQRGVNVGSVYLYDFLPLIVSAALFAGVSWYMLKLMARKQVGKTLSQLLLIAASLVLVLSFVAVIVKSHTSNTPSSQKETSDTSEFRRAEPRVYSPSDRRDSGQQEWKSRDSSRKSDATSTMKCYEDYQDSDDLDEYSRCLQDAYGSTRH